MIHPIMMVINIILQTYQYYFRQQVILSDGSKYYNNYIYNVHMTKDHTMTMLDTSIVLWDKDIMSIQLKTLIEVKNAKVALGKR